MPDDYAFACGYMEAAIHDALNARTLPEAQDTLRQALRRLEDDFGVSLIFREDRSDESR